MKWVWCDAWELTTSCSRPALLQSTFPFSTFHPNLSSPKCKQNRGIPRLILGWQVVTKLLPQKSPAASEWSWSQSLMGCEWCQETGRCLETSTYVIQSIDSWLSKVKSVERLVKLDLLACLLSFRKAQWCGFQRLGRGCALISPRQSSLMASSVRSGVGLAGVSLWPQVILGHFLVKLVLFKCFWPPAGLKWQYVHCYFRLLEVTTKSS